MLCLAIIRLILHLRVVASYPYGSREYSVLDLQHLQRGVLAFSSTIRSLPRQCEYRIYPTQ